MHHRHLPRQLGAQGEQRGWIGLVRRHEQCLGVVIVLLVGALLAWSMVASRGRARDFLDPEGPVFTGPLPAHAAPPIGRGSQGRFSVVSFNVHYGYATADIVPTLRANEMADADVFPSG